MSTRLTEKQRKFAKEYTVDYNGNQAAIRAGYSPKTARQAAADLLTKTNVLQAIKEFQAEAETKIVLNRNMVIEGLLKEASFTGQGASHAARVSAWEKLGKTMGMFVDKVENNTTLLIEKELEDLFESLGDGDDE